MSVVMWFRRDLRLSDNPALAAAVRHAGTDGEVTALFCLTTGWPARRGWRGAPSWRAA